MCEALRELFADELNEMKKQGLQEGIAEGIEQGIEQGEIQKAVHVVQNSMNRLGLSLEDACSLAEISVETYQKNI